MRKIFCNDRELSALTCSASLISCTREPLIVASQRIAHKGIHYGRMLRIILYRAVLYDYQFIFATYLGHRSMHVSCSWPVNITVWPLNINIDPKRLQSNTFIYYMFLLLQNDAKARVVGRCGGVRRSRGRSPAGQERMSRVRVAGDIKSSSDVLRPRRRHVVAGRHIVHHARWKVCTRIENINKIPLQCFPRAPVNY